MDEKIQPDNLVAAVLSDEVYHSEQTLTGGVTVPVIINPPAGWELIPFIEPDYDQTTGYYGEAWGKITSTPGVYSKVMIVNRGTTFSQPGSDEFLTDATRYPDTIETLHDAWPSGNSIDSEGDFGQTVGSDANIVASVFTATIGSVFSSYTRPAIFDSAEAFYSEVSQVVQGTPIIETGQSLGGALADAVVATNYTAGDLTADTFNALPYSYSFTNVPSSQRAQVNALVTNYYVGNEFFTQQTPADWWVFSSPVGGTQQISSVAALSGRVILPNLATNGPSVLNAITIHNPDGAVAALFEYLYRGATRADITVASTLLQGEYSSTQTRPPTIQNVLNVAPSWPSGGSNIAPMADASQETAIPNLDKSVTIVYGGTGTVSSAVAVVTLPTEAIANIGSTSVKAIPVPAADSGGVSATEADIYDTSGNLIEIGQTVVFSDGSYIVSNYSSAMVLQSIYSAKSTGDQLLQTYSSTGEINTVMDRGPSGTLSVQQYKKGSVRAEDYAVDNVAGTVTSVTENSVGSKLAKLDPEVDLQSLNSANPNDDQSLQTNLSSVESNTMMDQISSGTLSDPDLVQNYTVDVVAGTVTSVTEDSDGSTLAELNYNSSSTATSTVVGLVANLDGSADIVDGQGEGGTSGQIIDFSSAGLADDQLNVEVSSSGVVDVTTDIEPGAPTIVLTDENEPAIQEGFAFSGIGETLEIADVGEFTGVISTFVPGDTIDLATIGMTTSAFLDSNNVLYVNGTNSSTAFQLDPSHDYTGEGFSASDDGQGGTDVTVSSGYQYIENQDGTSTIIFTDTAGEVTKSTYPGPHGSGTSFNQSDTSGKSTASITITTLGNGVPNTYETNEIVDGVKFQGVIQGTSLGYGSNSSIILSNFSKSLDSPDSVSAIANPDGTVTITVSNSVGITQNVVTLDPSVIQGDTVSSFDFSLLPSNVITFGIDTDNSAASQNPVTIVSVLDGGSTEIDSSYIPSDDDFVFSGVNGSLTLDAYTPNLGIPDTPGGGTGQPQSLYPYPSIANFQAGDVIDLKDIQSDVDQLLNYSASPPSVDAPLFYEPSVTETNGVLDIEVLQITKASSVDENGNPVEQQSVLVVDQDLIPFTPYFGYAPTSISVQNDGNGGIEITTGDVNQSNGPEAAADLNIIYENALSRPIDAAGLTVWQSVLSEPGQSLATVQADIADSPEAAADLNIIYENTLDHPIDTAGLTVWQSVLSEPGQSLATVQADIADSPEAAADLNIIYENTLDHPIDTAGLTVWQPVLAEPGQSLATVQVDIADSPEAAADLNTIYENALGRPAGADGVAAWQPVLAEPGQSLATVQMGIADSPEAAADLNTIYENALGRPIDTAGLSVWQAVLAELGQSLTTVQADIADSQEAAADINSLYEDILGRPAGTDGVAAWQPVLTEPGQSLATVQTAIADSPEAAADLNTIYENALGRPIDTAGLSVWQSVLAEPGQSLTTVQVDITDSPEATADLNTIYEDVLGRSIDTAGLTVWQPVLAEPGQSLTTVQADIADSPEATADLNTVYEDVLGRPIDTAGLTVWQPMLAEPGQSLATVQTAISNSQEAAGDIRLIYRQVLNRGASAADLINSQQLLGQAGNTLFTVRSALAYSAEGQAEVAQILRNRPAGASDILAGQMQLADGLSVPNLTTQSVLLSTSPTFIVGHGGTLTVTGVVDVFEFGPGEFGQNTVTGFTSSHDILELSHTQFANLGAVLAAETSSNSGVQIILDGSNSILLAGVSASSLTPAAFRFV